MIHLVVLRRLNNHLVVLRRLNDHLVVLRRLVFAPNCFSGCRDLMSIAELSPEHKFKDLDVSCLSWNIICPQIPPPSHEEKWSGEPN